MKDKYLIEKKENIFTKILNFLKNLFKKDTKNNIEKSDIYSNEIYKDENQSSNYNNSISESTSKKEEYTTKYESDFLNYLRVDNRENPELLELQRRFESKEILMSEMSEKDLIRLNDLYNRQINNMKRDLENKKTKVGMLKFKLSKQILSWINTKLYLR